MILIVAKVNWKSECVNNYLKNKRFIVTGSSQGIGRAIAELLSSKSAKLALHYNSNRIEAEKLELKLKGEFKFFQADFSDSNSVLKFYDQAIQFLGGLDVLINNAGIAVESKETISDAQWINDFETTLQVNLIAAGLLCRKAITEFKKQKKGIIINISSRAAFRGDLPEYMSYAASKGGLTSLTRTIARNFGKDGITAFDVAPGFTKTAMAQQFIDEYGEDLAMKDIALNRLTEPRDIAPIIEFLASGLAEHATGTTIHVNAASYVH